MSDGFFIFRLHGRLKLKLKAGGECMESRVSETIKKMFPDDFGESKSMSLAWWKRIDYQRLSGKWPTWLFVIFSAIVVWGGVYYWNYFLRLDYEVTVEGHHVEVAFQRRKEVLENLSKKVLDYAAHEKELFEYAVKKRTQQKLLLSKEPVVADARSMRAIDTGAQPDGAQLSHYLGNFLAFIEGYPQLKLSENFQLLMKALIAAERDLAHHRMAYNKAKCKHCCKLDEFPAWIYANFAFGLDRYDYIQVDPDVKQLVPLDTGKKINSFQRDKWKTPVS
jgi:LemA protein